MIVEKSNTIIEQIYFLLWLKQEGLKDSFGIRIPDTVVMKGKQLLNWYFMSKKNEILMKRRNQLTRQNIYEKFAENN